MYTILKNTTFSEQNGLVRRTVGERVEEDSIWGEESHHAIPSGKCLIGNSLILQYHDDPKDTANAN